MLGFLSVGGALELAFRHWRPILHATSHRSLFKAALLERRLPQDIVFFGTSRTVEALRPASFVSELEQRGAPRLSAFNVATAYSSMEILDYVSERFSTEKGFKLAVIEVSEQQLQRMPLPWTVEQPKADDFDGRIAAWFGAHSALVSERKALVINSLSRLAVVALFGHSVDGTEIHGPDYARAMVGMNSEASADQFETIECLPRPLEEATEPLTSYAAERDLYVGIAKRLTDRGVRVAFYVPPTRAADYEAKPEHRALLASIAAKTGAPTLDYSGCAMPASYFRDSTHMSVLGGSHFSRLVVQQLMAADDIRRGVAADALP